MMRSFLFSRGGELPPVEVRLVRGLASRLHNGSGITGARMGWPDYPENLEKDRTKERGRRYLTNLPITVSLRGRDLEGYCNNIAEGGLGAFLPETVPKHSVVVLAFAIPGRQTIELRVQAAVRYQIGFQHGLEFLSLNDAELLAIRQFCTELPSIT